MIDVNSEQKIILLKVELFIKIFLKVLNSKYKYYYEYYSSLYILILIGNCNIFQTIKLKVS